MKFMMTIFGLLGGFVGGALATQNIIIGGIGAVIGGIIIKWSGKSNSLFVIDKWTFSSRCLF